MRSRQISGQRLTAWVALCIVLFSLFPRLTLASTAQSSIAWPKTSPESTEHGLVSKQKDQNLTKQDHNVVKRDITFKQWTDLICNGAAIIRAFPMTADEVARDPGRDPKVSGAKLAQSLWLNGADRERNGWTNFDVADDDNSWHEPLDDLHTALSALGISDHPEDWVILDWEHDNPQDPTKATGANYKTLFNLQQNAIVVIAAWGVEYRVKNYHPEIAQSDWPALRRWSDFCWLDWADAHRSGGINSIDWIIVHHVDNAVSTAVIQRIYNGLPEGQEPGPWPGITIHMDTDNGRALLAMPNGIGPALFILQHKGQGQLGLKRISQAQIFYDDSDPVQGQHGSIVPCVAFKVEDVPPPQPPQAPQRRALVKRVSDEDYDKYICNGNAIIRAFPMSADDAAKDPRNDPRIGAKLQQSSWTDGTDRSKNGWASKKPQSSLQQKILDPLSDSLSSLGLSTKLDDWVATDWLHDGNEDIQETIANFQTLYNVAGGAVIVADAWSVEYEIEQQDLVIPADRMPKLRRWSDFCFLDWVDVHASGGDIENLKTIIVHNVINRPSNDVINKAVAAAGKPETPWPGINVPLGSDEGKALLGMPNGIGAALFVLQHKTQLGQKRISQANIFYDNYKNLNGIPSETRCLYFKIEDVPPPPPPQRRAIAQRTPRPQRRRIVKRVTEEDYEGWRCLGYAIVHAFPLTAEDMALDPVDDLKIGAKLKQSTWTNPSALAANGWVRHHYGPDDDDEWKASLSDLSTALTGAGISTDPSDWKHIEWGQDNENDQVGATEAQFEILYNIKQGAIIALNSFGVEYQIKEMERDVPPNKLPNLRRWSDITFLDWQTLHPGGNGIGNVNHFFRYFVSGDEGVAVLDTIQQKLNIPKDVARPFPGSTIRMNTDEGQALLGMPNGIGPAMFILQHKNQLGLKRISETHIFHSNKIIANNGPYANRCLYYKVETAE